MKLLVTKLVTIADDLELSSSSSATIGQQIDGMIGEALDNGDQLHEIHLEFSPAEWNILRGYREASNPLSAEIMTEAPFRKAKR